VAGLYLIDKTFADDPRLDPWIARAKSLLTRMPAAGKAV
jgi:hypothetical protein